MATIFEQLSKDSTDGLESSRPPDEKIIDWLHQRVSTVRPTDIHHRLGFGPTDAAPGDHTHNGIDSKGLFNPATVILTDLGATPTTTEIKNAINAIHAVLRLLGAG